MSIGVADALARFRKSGLFTLVGLAGFLVGDLAYSYLISTERSPDQPIAFSHRIHAGENAIPCMYCHVNAARSPSATVPDRTRCMGCHRDVATDSPEIEKLRSYWRKDEPIRWVKVHDVPDFVYFPHKRHIQAGLDCQVCHGPVETMEKVRRVESLKMPFCTDCHEQRQVEHGTDCWTCHK